MREVGENVWRWNFLEENGNLENGIFVVVKEGKENREKEKGKRNYKMKIFS